MQGALDVAGGGREYRLYVQKQPGTRAVPLDVAVQAPPGMRIETVALDGVELKGNQGEIRSDLRQDRNILIRFTSNNKRAIR